MKKRFTSALLSLCLLMGLFSAAYADTVIVDNIESTTGDNYQVFDETADAAYTSGEIDINAQLANSEATLFTDVYKVEIMWGDTAFAYGYAEPEIQTWDHTTHTYYVEEGNLRSVKEWWLINGGTVISLPEGTDAAYEGVTAGTDQNYVLLFNHSNKPVNANISLVEVNAGDDDDNITAELVSDNEFGVDGIAAVDEASGSEKPNSFDYALRYDPAADDTTNTLSPVLYSSKKVDGFNNTSAAAYVQLSGDPAEGALDTTVHTTVARITVTLTLPVEAVVTP